MIYEFPAFHRAFLRFLARTHVGYFDTQLQEAEDAIAMLCMGGEL